MDEREKRQAIRAACDAIKFAHPEINDAWHSWQEAAEAAGLDFDEVIFNRESSNLPPAVLAAHRHLEAIETIIEARIAGILETPVMLLGGSPERRPPMVRTARDERSDDLAAQKALLKKLDAYLLRYHDQPDYDEALDDGAESPITVGDLRQMYQAVRAAVEKNETALRCSELQHADA
jgi:hypothetical protein